jgi:hypothetical protein
VTAADRLADFLGLSAIVTAFTEFELLGTGLADAYLATVVDIVGEDTADALLEAYRRVLAGAPEAGAAQDDLLRALIFSDAKLGPIARNVIKMWYVGIWYELPPAWTEAFGALGGNVTFTVSAAAYTEGLLWPAIGANPPGAKAPGYGSWADPPRIPAVVSAPSARVPS